MPDARWVSVHAYYHGDADRLLLEVVQPLVERLRAQHRSARWFFLRYWEGGPHIRLRVLPAATADASGVGAELSRTLAAWLLQYPSADLLDARDYRRIVERQADLEGVRSAASQLRPNNTVEVAAYVREHDVYGSDRALEAAEQHFETSSEIAMSVLAGSDGRGERVGSAVAVLTLTMAACDVAPAHLAEWLTATWRRSWSPGGRDGVAPIAFDADPDDRVVARVRALWTRARSTAADGGAAERWLRSLQALRTRLLAEPALPVAAATSPMVPSAAPGPGPAGAVIPALLRCAHLYNNRIGLSGQAEGRVFAVVTRALQRIEPDQGGAS